MYQEKSGNPAGRREKKEQRKISRRECSANFQLLYGFFSTLKLLVAKKLPFELNAGLPDYSWYQKAKKYTKMTTKYTKWS
jgi:hypothetical protein